MNAVAQIKASLHHNAYVCKDLEAVRKFYEEIIGFKLVATWAEQTDLFGKMRTYAHCFLRHRRRLLPGVFPVRR
jgi:glyoxylase I family protein